MHVANRYSRPSVLFENPLGGALRSPSGRGKRMLRVREKMSRGLRFSGSRGTPRINPMPMANHTARIIIVNMGRPADVPNKAMAAGSLSAEAQNVQTNARETACGRE